MSLPNQPERTFAEPEESPLPRLHLVEACIGTGCATSDNDVEDQLRRFCAKHGYQIRSLEVGTTAEEHGKFPGGRF